MQGMLPAACRNCIDRRVASLSVNVFRCLIDSVKLKSTRKRKGIN